MELSKYDYFLAQKSEKKAGDNKFQDLINAPRICFKIDKIFFVNI